MEDNTTVVIDIQLQESDVAKRLADVNGQMEALRKENAKMRKSVKDGEKSWKDVSTQLAANESALKSLKREQGALTNQIGNATKSTMRVYGDSLKEQAAKLADLKNEYQNLSKAEREGAQGQELIRHIQELDEAVKAADYSQGNFQRNVGNYPDAVKPVTAQLREMTQELIRLRIEGKANTAEYQELLQKTGQMKDAMSDAQNAVKQLASDTGTLNSVLDAGKLAAGAFSAALGIMNLVGDKDSETAKELAEAQRKLQAAIAITTGLQAVQNALQKESALMMGVAKIQIWAAAKAQDAYTAAAGRATIAQRLFNTVAKSNPYVLLAGLILSVVGAVAAFTAGSSEQEDQLEKTNEELRNQIQLLKEIKEAYVSLYSESIDLQERYVKELKIQGAETEKIRAAEDELFRTRMSALDEEYDALKNDIALLGQYQANMLDNLAKLKDAKEKYYDAVNRGQDSLAEKYRQEMTDLQSLIEIDKERIDLVNDYNKRRSDLVLEGIEREKQREEEDRRSAQEEDRRSAQEEAERRRRAQEEAERRRRAYEDYVAKLRQAREATKEALKDIGNLYAVTIDDVMKRLHEAFSTAEDDAVNALGDRLKGDTFSKQIADAYGDLDELAEKLERQSNPFYNFAQSYKENAETIQETSAALESSFSSLSSMYQAMARDESKTEEERETAARKAKAWAKMQIAANAGTAVAKGVASAVDVGFPAAIPAILTMTSAIIAAIAQAKQLASDTGFETGGVIGGYRGATMGKDNTFASVRTGEMIINAKQQRQLFELANGGASTSLAASLAEALRAMPAPTLVYSEFKRFSDRVVTIDESSKLH